MGWAGRGWAWRRSPYPPAPPSSSSPPNPGPRPPRSPPPQENYEGWRARVAEPGGGRGWALLRGSLHDPLLVLNAESSLANGGVVGWRGGGADGEPSPATPTLVTTVHSCRPPRPPRPTPAPLAPPCHPFTFKAPAKSWAACWAFSRLRLPTCVARWTWRSCTTAPARAPCACEAGGGRASGRAGGARRAGEAGGRGGRDGHAAAADASAAFRGCCGHCCAHDSMTHTGAC